MLLGYIMIFQPTSLAGSTTPRPVSKSEPTGYDQNPFAVWQGQLARMNILEIPLVLATSPIFDGEKT